MNCEGYPLSLRPNPSGIIARWKRGENVIFETRQNFCITIACCAMKVKLDFEKLARKSELGRTVGWFGGPDAGRLIMSWKVNERTPYFVRPSQEGVTARTSFWRNYLVNVAEME